MLCRVGVDLILASGVSFRIADFNFATELEFEFTSELTTSESRKGCALLWLEYPHNFLYSWGSRRSFIME
jgi:hypothetical protein